jgi:predicted TIM-barrel fold metal-dependent hydrolase
LGAEVDEVLAAHRQASPTRFRGIRHACGWDASPDVRNSHTDPPAGLYLIPRFREGFSRLHKFGLVFDSWHYHTQIPELTLLARAFPGVTIVLDHVGGPLGIGPYAGKRDEVFRLWKMSISELSTCPNVVVKLGGLQMPVCGFRWHKRPRPPGSAELAAATEPYYMHCIESFGVERCMFESNFPVDKASCSYTVLWNTFKRLTAAFTRKERAQLFHDNAVRVYRLAPEPRSRVT